MITRISGKRRKRSQVFYCSVFRNKQNNDAYQNRTSSGFSPKISALPRLLETHLIRQAFKLQIYRHGMRWSDKDLRHHMHSEYSWTCFVTLPANNFVHQLQGFLLLRVIEDEAEILSIGVKKRVRRNGIGKYLIEQAKRFSTLHQLRSILLEVAETNRNAVGFYKKQGFLKIGIRNNYYVFSGKNKKNALIMHLPIKKYKKSKD
ncbi:GNAT family N-acetyltransferase [Alphaproteobacteria bacterium]|nr:GNAT family N-acetyltransferase [Alphaproteobacteria bacterium]